MSAEALSDRERCYPVSRKQSAFFGKTNRSISEALIRGLIGRKKLSPYPIDKSLNYSKKYDFWKIKSSNF
jgi:hypothetical protein